MDWEIEVRRGSDPRKESISSSGQVAVRAGLKGDRRASREGSS